MSAVKQFRISTSLRSKGFELLSRYSPSDLAYTLGASIYDKMNKMQASMSGNPTSEEKKALKKKKDCYFKAAKRFVAVSQSLKLLEMQYLL
jgi:hypothetical protein